MGFRFVFLDIDGVLQPYRWGVADKPRVCREILEATNGCPPFDPACVAELNRVCREGKATIVISSTWRYHIPSLNVLRAVLREQGVEATVNGMLPICNEHLSFDSRGDEMRFFMRNIDVEAFVVLDDADMGWGGLGRHWVKIHGGKGLQPEDSDKALEILLNGPGWKLI